MLKYLEHRQLAARGLTCGKTRRRVERNKFWLLLEKAKLIRLLLIIAIGIGFGALDLYGSDPYAPQRVYLTLFIFVAALGHLWISGSEVLRSNSRLILVFGALLTQGVLLKFLLLHGAHDSLYTSVVPFLLPYAFAPLALSVLLGKSVGLFATLFGSLWIAFLFSSSHPLFMITSLITGLVAVFATRHVRRRSLIIRAGIYSGIAAGILAIIFGKLSPLEYTTLKNIPWSLLFFQSMTAVGSGLCTAILVSGLLPILEWIFRIKTDISWLEMSDLNHPLLRRLSLEAPGTYQHSLALAQLAEAAAAAIGANTTICRVGAYFHDIGKLVKPEYFTENISSEKNPHDALTPTMSALIISAHIKEGVDLALKNKLPLRIIDIIRQHHGTTMIRYFFQRARQQQEDAKLEGKMMNLRPQDIPDLATENFRYPGPKPQSKEAAIIGLADAAESASRSIEKPTPQRLDDLVHELLEERLHDGQYDECPITMKELHQVVDALVLALLGMLHSRISYKKHTEREQALSAPGAEG